MKLSALVVAGGYSTFPGTRWYRFAPEFIWGIGGLIAVTVGGNIMRATLAVAVGFCLAFPLSAGAASGACTPGAQATCAQAVNSDFSAARRHRTRNLMSGSPPLTDRYAYARAREEFRSSIAFRLESHKWSAAREDFINSVKSRVRRGRCRPRRIEVHLNNFADTAATRVLDGRRSGPSARYSLRPYRLVQRPPRSAALVRSC